MNHSLWSTPERSAYFLIADDRVPALGSLAIRRLDGKTVWAAPDWLAPFAVTEEQARRVAKDQLGQTLDKLKHGIDERLAGLRERLDQHDLTPVSDDTPLTPNAAPALFEFLKKLPGVIVNSLAHDAQRVESAKTTMADLQRRLKEAGIDLDERFTDFPHRLAQLREDERKRQP
jgi:hypothetical protein